MDLKVKEAIWALGRKNIYVYILPFSYQWVGAREELRQELVRKIKDSKDFKSLKRDFDWGKLLKPGSKPKSPFSAISISHSEGLSAFVFVFEKALSIGLDVEKKDRITKKLVSRVSSKREVSLAPSPAWLWPAKEASFKCLSDGGNHLFLSDCSISHWREDSKAPQAFFECYSKKIGKRAFGVAFFIDDLALAYAESPFSPLEKSGLLLEKTLKQLSMCP